MTKILRRRGLWFCQLKSCQSVQSLSNLKRLRKREEGRKSMIFISIRSCPMSPNSTNNHCRCPESKKRWTNGRRTRVWKRRRSCRWLESRDWLLSFQRRRRSKKKVWRRGTRNNVLEWIKCCLRTNPASCLVQAGLINLNSTLTRAAEWHFSRLSQPINFNNPARQSKILWWV